MTRSWWAVLVVLAVAPGAVHAQDPVPTAQQQAYETRRQQLLREAEETEQRLTELRRQRVMLQARVEAAIAEDLRQRSEALMMSEEQTALQSLDSILVQSRDNLAEQRERFQSLGSAVRRRTGAVLVVLLRADSSSAEQALAAANLQINGAGAATRSYNAEMNNALRLGAVDQLYRADVLPTRHSVQVSVTVNGQPLSQSIDVDAQGETVTYVQFAIRNGQLVSRTWTARGTTPF
ncbi:MAG TPA: hypothetical protein VK922_14510 [Gemmatimonadaceae bacterium]|nr:hypothetical protein [Gemmatimonadaceae bacterium]